MEKLIRLKKEFEELECQLFQKIFPFTLPVYFKMRKIRKKLIKWEHSGLVRHKDSFNGVRDKFIRMAFWSIIAILAGALIMLSFFKD